MTSIFRTQVKGSVLPIEEVLQSTSGAGSIKTSSGLSIQETLDAILAALAGGGVPNPTPGGSTSDSFAYVSVNDWSQYVAGQDNALDYGLRIKLDKVSKKLYLNFKGFKTTAGNPPANFVFFFQVSGASLVFVTKTGDLTTLTYSTQPLTFSSADNNKWSTNGSYITADISDSEEKEYVFTLSAMTNSVFFKFTCVNIEAFATNTFLSCGDRLLNVNPGPQFKFGFNSIDNQVNTISWDNVVGSNKPQDNATYGAEWSIVTGIGKPEDFSTRQRVFLQATQPTTDVTFEDIWFDNSDGNHPHVFDLATNNWTSVRDTAIQEAIDIANAASAMVNAKVTVYYQESPPDEFSEIPPSQNDLWINISNEKQLMIFREGAWQSARDDKIGIAFFNANYALSEVIKKSTCYINEADPRSIPDSNVATGTLWLDLNSNGLKIFDEIIDDWRQVSRFVDSTSQLTDDAELGKTAEWYRIFGVGKPENFATNTMTYVQSFPPIPEESSTPFNSSYQWIDTGFGRNWPRYWNPTTEVWDIKRDNAAVDFEDHRDDTVRDDHLQYFNQTRGDARYYTKTQIDDLIDGVSAINRPISVSSDYVIKSWEFVVADARTENFDLRLPAVPEENDVIKIFKYGTHSLNVLGNGNSIENQAGISIDESRAHLCLIYLGTELGWAILYNIVPSPAFMTHVLVVRSGFDFGSNSEIDMDQFALTLTTEDFDVNSNIQLDVEQYAFGALGEDFLSDSRGIAFETLSLIEYSEFEADVHFIVDFDRVDLLEYYDAVSLSHFEIEMDFATAWTVEGYDFSVNSRGLELEIGSATVSGVDFEFASHKEYQFLQNVVYLDFQEFDFNSNFSVEMDSVDATVTTYDFDSVSNGLYVDLGDSPVVTYDFEADSRGVHVDFLEIPTVTYDFDILYRSVDFDTYSLVITTPEYYAQANGLVFDLGSIEPVSEVFEPNTHFELGVDLLALAVTTNDFETREYNEVEFDSVTMYEDFDFSVNSGSGPVAHRIPVTVPTSSISANLTDFPVYVDLSLMPIEFWDNLKYEDGRDIRVKTAGGTDIPFHAVWVSKEDSLGYLFVKTDLNTTTATQFYIHVFQEDNPVLIEATNGSATVWENYATVVLHDKGIYDAANLGKNMNGYFSDPISAHLSWTNTTPTVNPLSGTIGVDIPNMVIEDGSYRFILKRRYSSEIIRFDSAWTEEATLDMTPYLYDSTRFRYGYVDSGHLHYLYAFYDELEEITLTKIGRIQLSNFTEGTPIDVSSDWENVEIMCRSKDGTKIYGLVTNLGTTSILKEFSASTYALLNTYTLDTDLVASDEFLYAFWEDDHGLKVSSGAGTGDVDILIKRSSTHFTSRRYIDAMDGDIFGPVLLSSEFPDTYIGYDYGTSSFEFFYVSEITAQTSTGPVMALGANASSVTMNPMLSTVAGEFTVSVTTSPSILLTTEYGAIMMLADAGYTNELVVGLQDDTNYFMLKDSVNGATLVVSSVEAEVDTKYRVSATYTGAGTRKLFVNGTMASDSISNEITWDSESLVFGSEISPVASNFYSGAADFAYISKVPFSDAYIAAEHSNILSPSTFYSVGTPEAL